MTDKEGPLQVITAIICDDVRREANGKDILIGVYGSGMRVEAIPHLIMLAFWLELKTFEIGSHEFSMRIMAPNEAIIFQSPPTRINVENIGYSHMALGGVPVQISTTGKMEFQVSISGGEWKTVREIGVEVGPIVGQNPT